MTWNDEKYGERKEYDTNVEYHPYQRNEDESERSRSGENSKGKIISNRPADPAQSAPSAPHSAEAFFSENGMECVPERTLVICERYAALRTAQLERERDAAKQEATSYFESWSGMKDKAIKLERRAETAESALRDAKNAIDASGHLTTCQFRGCTCGSTEKYIELRTEFMRKWRLAGA